MEDLLNILGWLLSIATLTGNGFVVFLIAKNRRLYSSANCFILSLAVADFGVGIAVFPPGYFCYSSLACNFRVYTAFFWFFLHSSVTNLCTLTWDRYNAIVHPLKYINSITERRPQVVILAAWLIPFAISLSMFVGMYVTNSNTALKVLRLTGVSGFDIMSCALLFYAVVRILVVARAQSRQVSAIELHITSDHSRTSSTELATSRRRRKHSTVPFVIALVVFFLGCYTAVNYLVLCSTLSCHKAFDKTGQVTTILLVLNSAVNPLVYALLKRDIKREISKLVWRRNNNRERSLLRTIKVPVPSFYYGFLSYMPSAFIVYYAKGSFSDI